jgi:hypothetical protein
MKALTLNIDGTTNVVEFTNDTCYETLRTAVDGWIEHVQLPHLGVDMWLNEEGKLTGLATNDQATLMWARSYGPCDIIKGNVIFTSGLDAEGETLGLNDDQIDRIKAEIVDFTAVRVISLDEWNGSIECPQGGDCSIPKTGSCTCAEDDD